MKTYAIFRQRLVPAGRDQYEVVLDLIGHVEAASPAHALRLAVEDGIHAPIIGEAK